MTQIYKFGYSKNNEQWTAYTVTDVVANNETFEGVKIADQIYYMFTCELFTVIFGDTNSINNGEIVWVYINEIDKWFDFRDDSVDYYQIASYYHLGLDLQLNEHPYWAFYTKELFIIVNNNNSNQLNYLFK